VSKPRLQATITPDAMKMLDRISRRAGMSRSSMVEILIRERFWADPLQRPPEDHTQTGEQGGEQNG